MRAIAIDGPAGAGKSSIARCLAKRLGYIYVDTGALYRTVGLAVSRKGWQSDRTEDIVALLPSLQIDLRFVEGEQRVFLQQEDVSELIRTPEASQMASDVSAIGAVRDFLFDLQRDLAKENNVIMDGRDIGTVVLPEADVKIFLTASPEERARRRHLQLAESGMQVDYDKLLEEIKQRDHQDSHRAIAPLKQAEDAVLVDTTDKSFEEAVAYMEALIRQKLEEKGEEI